jgi:hypothetical protein
LPLDSSNGLIESDKVRMRRADHSDGQILELLKHRAATDRPDRRSASSRKAEAKKRFGGGNSFESLSRRGIG